jgi:hypothetical protein
MQLRDQNKPMRVELPAAKKQPVTYSSGENMIKYSNHTAAICKRTTIKNWYNKKVANCHLVTFSNMAAPHAMPCTKKTEEAQDAQVTYFEFQAKPQLKRFLCMVNANQLVHHSVR